MLRNYFTNNYNKNLQGPVESPLLSFNLLDSDVVVITAKTI